MRHYASIPFGGKNITDDIKSECQISERLAENIKLAYGACMPEKLQSLSEKVLHIRSNNTEPDKQITVKYLSEIITARIEEIIMAMLYEINESGFADMLRSGIVITGGVAQTANLGNFIYDLSGYRVRTGYPKQQFSNAGYDGLKDTSAATSVGLIMAAKDEQGINCTYGKEKGNGNVIIETGEGPETLPPAPSYEDQDVTAAEPASSEEASHQEVREEEQKPRKRDSIFNAIWRKTKDVTARTEKFLDKLSEEEV